jgi:hypothetical protein
MSGFGKSNSYMNQGLTMASTREQKEEGNSVYQSATPQGTATFRRSRIQ